MEGSGRSRKRSSAAGSPLLQNCPARGARHLPGWRKPPALRGAPPAETSRWRSRCTTLVVPPLPCLRPRIQHVRVLKVCAVLACLCVDGVPSNVILTARPSCSSLWQGPLQGHLQQPATAVLQSAAVSNPSSSDQDVKRPGEGSCKHACGYLLISSMVGTFSALQVPGTAA